MYLSDGKWTLFIKELYNHFLKWMWNNQTHRIATGLGQIKEWEEYLKMFIVDIMLQHVITKLKRN